jgi:DNA (cytosine-5)-methyltransferase 1
MIPVIDLFAGPGGLGEGFSSILDPVTGDRSFRIGLSIEKNAIAHRTLELRAFFRAFGDGKAPDAYYDYLHGRITRSELFDDPRFRSEVEEARAEAVCAELGVANEAELDRKVRAALGTREDWVLIGGPPCQAYSLVGRSRMRGEDVAKFETDPRHFLYREYLRVIRTHRPAVFVMENVKGLLSASHAGQGMFERIHRDLTSPSDDLQYELRSFVVDKDHRELCPSDFVIRANLFGVPQARHRVILLGVRKDYAARGRAVLTPRSEEVSMGAVINGLPKLRSRLSKEPDSHRAWVSALVETRKLLRGWRAPERPALMHELGAAVSSAEAIIKVGAPFISDVAVSYKGVPSHLADWYRDNRVRGVVQHATRSHMRRDLQRYLFASAFARVASRSPSVLEFPVGLWPDHANILDEGSPFKDRFRVALRGQPSATIVSHLAKDGHAFIHPDPAQCRSLTVREAARLQTFPDNYFFEGGQTDQYTQVGNAVPPYLARQLAQVVEGLVRNRRELSSQHVQSEIAVA